MWYLLEYSIDGADISARGCVIPRVTRSVLHQASSCSVRVARFSPKRPGFVSLCAGEDLVSMGNRTKCMVAQDTTCRAVSLTLLCRLFRRMRCSQQRIISVERSDQSRPRCAPTRGLDLSPFYNPWNRDCSFLTMLPEVAFACHDCSPTVLKLPEWQTVGVVHDFYTVFFPGGH